MTTSPSILFSSIVRYSRFGRRIFVKRGYPVGLVFLPTSRCQLKCLHCYVQKGDGEGELSVHEIERLSKTLSPLLWLTVGGGEPFIREDLPELLIPICRGADVIHLTITTNGFEPERVFHSTERLLLSLPRTFVAVSVSLDGPSYIHDRIRNREQVFRTAIETIKKLGSLKRRYRNFGLTITTVINRINIPHLPSFLRWASRSLPIDNIIINIIRGEIEREWLKEVDPKDYRRITSLKEEMIRRGEMGRFRFPLHRIPSSRERLLYRLVYRTLTEKKRLIPCYAGNLFTIMNYNGGIIPCEPLPIEMGNIREFDYDFKKLWNSERAREVRNKIAGNDCYCTYECGQTLNILFHPPSLIRLLTMSL